ncbi:MAG: L,D-transpeptidase [Leptolyngbyaceae cyanobacterium SM1_1_3]|nr:L,D-transpeptidase [Leptolyngbyaceae cyanobacterium SM1_1_3]NJN01404.1 L,D-transpeptidase [Leptolyngbyaceae cyanobacterium RM1_1_2]NJO09583.1 L,D-transpeptidase [Leptolyngbyaceae cyanobacterium SL_1_1]
MLAHQPVTRCFMVLCFGAAALLVAAEWASPQLRQPPPVGSPKTLWSYEGFDVDLRVSPQAKNTKLVVSLAERQLRLYVKDEPVASYEIAVGQDDWQTPAGSFKVRHKQEYPAWQHPITGEVVLPGPDNPLGSRWLGFWSDGKYAIGFHGTNQEELIGQAVSHGCIRLRDRDIRDLYDRVELGTAVIVNP